jgi:proteasome lid subunit RPN8/RPN11
LNEIPLRFVISEKHWQTMLAHILACLPEEGCGLVGGHFMPDGAHSRAILPVTNDLHSPVRFYMSPGEQIRALTWLDENCLDLVAIFHSHPGGPGVPSATDLAEFAYPGVLYLILSPAGGSVIDREWQMRAYWIEEGGVVTAIPLEVTAGC